VGALAAPHFSQNSSCVVIEYFLLPNVFCYSIVDF
jgi:hypothetical protein